MKKSWISFIFIIMVVINIAALIETNVVSSIVSMIAFNVILVLLYLALKPRLVTPKLKGVVLALTILFILWNSFPLIMLGTMYGVVLVMKLLSWLY